MTPLVWNNPLGTHTLRPPLYTMLKPLSADRNGDVSMQTTDRANNFETATLCKKRDKGGVMLLLVKE